MNGPLPEGLGKVERRFVELLQHPRAPYVFAAIGVLLCAPSLFIGFYLDDHIGRYVYSDLPGGPRLFRILVGGYGVANGDRADTLWQIEQGFAPWWTYPDLLLALMRPTGVLTHIVDFALFPKSAFLMHLHSLIWLGVLVLGVTRAYRSLLGPIVGSMAGLLLAIDHTHGMSAGYITNRHTMLAGAFAFSALAAHLAARARREKKLWAASLVLYVLALLSSEASTAIVAYMFAFALFAEQGPWRARLLPLVPYVVVTLIWRVIYMALGFGARGSGLYLDPSADPIAFASELAVRAPLLLLGQFLFPPAELHAVAPAPVQHAMVALALALICVLAFVLLPLFRRDRRARALALGMLLALVPASGTYPQNRQLMFASFGAMALLAQLWSLYALDLRAAALSGMQAAQKVLSAMLLFGHLVLSPLILPITACSIVFASPLQSAPDVIPDSVAGKELVFVTAPDFFAVKLVHLMRRVDGQPLPRSFRALSFGPQAVDVLRRDAQTLELTFEGGLIGTPFMELYRSRHLPMHVGERVQLEGLTIEVLEVTADQRQIDRRKTQGRPLRASFRFAAPLEPERYAFYAWRDGRFTPFELPAIGGKSTLPAATLSFGVE